MNAVLSSRSFSDTLLGSTRRARHDVTHLLVRPLSPSPSFSPLSSYPTRLLRSASASSHPRQTSQEALHEHQHEHEHEHEHQQHQHQHDLEEEYGRGKSGSDSEGRRVHFSQRTEQIDEMSHRSMSSQSTSTEEDQFMSASSALMDVEHRPLLVEGGQVEEGEWHPQRTSPTYSSIVTPSHDVAGVVRSILESLMQAVFHQIPFGFAASVSASHIEPTRGFEQKQEEVLKKVMELGHPKHVESAAQPEQKEVNDTFQLLSSDTSPLVTNSVLEHFSYSQPDTTAQPAVTEHLLIEKKAEKAMNPKEFAFGSTDGLKALENNLCQTQEQENAEAISATGVSGRIVQSNAACNPPLPSPSGEIVNGNKEQDDDAEERQCCLHHDSDGQHSTAELDERMDYSQYQGPEEDESMDEHDGTDETIEEQPQSVPSNEEGDEFAVSERCKKQFSLEHAYFRSHVEAHEQDWQEIRAENRELINRVYALQSEIEDHERSREEERGRFRNDYQLLDHQLSQAHDTIHNVGEQIENIRKDNEALQRTVQESTMRANDAETQHAVLQLELNKTRDRLEQLQAAQVRDYQAWHLEEGKLRAHAEAHDLSLQLVTSQAQLESAKKDIERLLQENARLVQQCESLNLKKEEIQDKNTVVIAELQVSLHKVSVDNAQLRSVSENVRSQLNDRIVLLEEKKGELKELHQKLENYSKSLQDMRLMSQELKQKERDITQSQHERAKLIEELTKSQSLVAELKLQEENFNRSRREKEKEEATLRAQLEEAQSSCIQLRTIQTLLHEQINELKQEKQRAQQGEREHAQQKQEELKRVDLLESKCAHLRTVADERQIQLMHARAESLQVCAEQLIRLRAVEQENEQLKRKNIEMKSSSSDIFSASGRTIHRQAPSSISHVVVDETLRVPSKGTNAEHISSSVAPSAQNNASAHLSRSTRSQKDGISAFIASLIYSTPAIISSTSPSCSSPNDGSAVCRAYGNDDEMKTLEAGMAVEPSPGHSHSMETLDQQLPSSAIDISCNSKLDAMSSFSREPVSPKTQPSSTDTTSSTESPISPASVSVPHTPSTEVIATSRLSMDGSLWSSKKRKRDKSDRIPQVIIALYSFDSETELIDKIEKLKGRVIPYNTQFENLCPDMPDDQVTHLLMNKTSTRAKPLISSILGKCLCTPEWLEDSIRAGKFLKVGESMHIHQFPKVENMRNKGVYVDDIVCAKEHEQSRKSLIKQIAKVWKMKFIENLVETTDDTFILVNKPNQKPLAANARGKLTQYQDFLMLMPYYKATVESRERALLNVNENVADYTGTTPASVIPDNGTSSQRVRRSLRASAPNRFDISEKETRDLNEAKALSRKEIANDEHLTGNDNEENVPQNLTKKASKKRKT